MSWNVTGRPLPSLWMWIAPGNRMLLTQNDHPVLLARVTDDHCDVTYLRTDAYRSPIPPIRHDQATRRSPARNHGWAEFFRAALTDTETGPLRDGAWAICPAQVALPSLTAGRGDRTDPDAVLDEPSGEIDWFGMRIDLLPLGPVPDPETDRVKAYRKLARDGDLPPVLTWWVTGLQALVVIDGLCRLAAAWAHGIPATLLTLVEVDPDRVADDQRRAVDSYRTTTFGIRLLDGEGARRAHAHLSHHLADALQAAQTRGITRAWPLPGGAQQWQLTAHDHGWPT